MSRVTTAYASKYQLDRTHNTALYPGAKATFTANFAGLDLGHIESATWYTSAPWATILSLPTKTGPQTTVSVQAGQPDNVTLFCKASMHGGGTYTVTWLVDVKSLPTFFNPPAQGPQSVTV